jgi:aspartyl-tRNA(Asn)/glutamyl-tRNA(Gln) amidotransferase subunit A
MDFRTTTVAQLADDVRSRRTSARELAQAALDRIDEVDGKLNAFCALDPDRTLAAADALDRRLVAGEDVGPLAGVPLAVKDMEDAAGFRTTLGSVTRRDASLADRDSELVARLKRAGCVVVGKTNVPELGLRGETDNRLHGITRNPWGLDRTPGGSSGGSAAALAAGLVPLATGSDGGGSIRIPAAVTGLSSLKPSLGRVPDADPTPPGWPLLSSRGPMARRIADVALALDCAVGPHANDHRSLPAKGESWHAELGRWRPSRIGWSPDLGYGHVDGELVRVLEAALEVIAGAGVEVVRLAPVFPQDPGLVLGSLVQTYVSRAVEPYRGTPLWDEIDPMVIGLAEVQRRAAKTAIELVQSEDGAHEVNLQLQAAMAGVDLLVCPTQQGQTAFCEVPTTVDEILASVDASVIDAALGEDAEVLFDAMRSREPINLPVGLIDGQPALDWHGMTQAFNLTRSPAGTVNAGFTADGMPVGLQVVGHQHADLQVLSGIALFEEVLGIDAVAPIG